MSSWSHTPVLLDGRGAKIVDFDVIYMPVFQSPRKGPLNIAGSLRLNPVHWHTKVHPLLSLLAPCSHSFIYLQQRSARSLCVVIISVRLTMPHFLEICSNHLWSSRTSRSTFLNTWTTGWGSVSRDQTAYALSNRLGSSSKAHSQFASLQRQHSLSQNGKLSNSISSSMSIRVLSY